MRAAALEEEMSGTTLYRLARSDEDERQRSDSAASGASNRYKGAMREQL